MAMSKDRVRFTVPAHNAHSHTMRELIKDAFGHTLYKDYRGDYPVKDVTIICRPSQFARFLILRNERGMSNGFKELAPTLFTPEDELPPEIDVSKNPNTVGDNRGR